MLLQPMARLLLAVPVLLVLIFASSSAPAGVMRASWYQTSLSGHNADGTRFNPDDPATVAHKTLAFGTKLLLTNLKNGRQLEAVVRDRGPFIKGRSIDLTRAGARDLGFKDAGTALLEVEVIQPT
jgi:rare lipoprotein A